ncbi:MAG: 3'-5' exonuclease, partial [Pseudomonadota bacterium]
MATMIPDKVIEFTTEGEGRFYTFMQTVARPDEDHICWYNPDVQDREPDFILYSKDLGLIVFEVKDWALDQVLEADPISFRLSIGEMTESRESPLRQAKAYVNALIDMIRKDGRLLNTAPQYRGKVKVPINCGVVFPNINKLEYTEKHLDQVIPTDRIFFWDDLHPASDICSDPSGKCFCDSLASRFPPPFPCNLSPGEASHLRHLIFPLIRVALPERQGGGITYDRRSERLHCLDHHQEVIARKYEGGHRILTGPPGSGKTLVLVYKAGFLKRYNPQITSILIVCYNIALPGYIRALLMKQGIPMGPAGVQVKHFYELCADILGEPVEYDSKEPGYYDLIREETLSKVKDSEISYDAILVDEGQDFSVDMLRIITSVLNPKTNNLTIALDNRQRIYDADFTWKDAGINAKGRIHNIGTSYRNTHEIITFADQFAGNAGEGGTAAEKKQLPLFPSFSGFHGPNPEITQHENFNLLIDSIAGTIQALHKTEGEPYSEMAVLYAMQNPGHLLDAPIPALMKTALEARGILSTWLSEDYRAKHSYDVTSDRVTISTIHSAKGLDWANVFIVGIDYIEPKEWSENQIR